MNKRADYPDHLRDFHAALAAEGFEAGKIAGPGEPYDMDQFVADVISASHMAQLTGLDIWHHKPPTSKPIPPQILSGIDKAIALAGAVLEALALAETEEDAARAADAPGEPPGPLPAHLWKPVTVPDATPTESTRPTWMARIRRWMAKIGQFTGFFAAG